MIPNYPLFGFPNYLKYANNNYKKPFQKSTNYSPNPQAFNSNFAEANYNNIVNHKGNSNIKTFSDTENKTNFKYSSNQKNIDQQKKNNYDNFYSKEQPIINISGINLYFDDILIICLIFFLYSEKVTDYYLFFVLILLLLT